MSGAKRRSGYRKSVVSTSAADDGEPGENRLLARVLRAAGDNHFVVELAPAPAAPAARLDGGAAGDGGGLGFGGDDSVDGKSGGALVATAATGAGAASTHVATTASAAAGGDGAAPLPEPPAPASGAAAPPVTGLALLPSRFRKLLWIKRGDPLLVSAGSGSTIATTAGGEGGGKVAFLIESVVSADAARALRAAGRWPAAWGTPPPPTAAAPAGGGAPAAAPAAGGGGGGAGAGRRQGPRDLPPEQPDEEEEEEGGGEEGEAGGEEKGGEADEDGDDDEGAGGAADDGARAGGDGSGGGGGDGGDGGDGPRSAAAAASGGASGRGREDGVGGAATGSAASVDTAVDDEAARARSAEALRESGNAAFTSREFAAAEAAYTAALDALGPLPAFAAAAGGGAADAAAPSAAASAATSAAAAAAMKRRAVLHGNRAAARSRLGSAEASLADARASVALDPAWGKAHARLGVALSAAGQHADAAEAYAAALALAPAADAEGARALETQRRASLAAARRFDSVAVPATPAAFTAAFRRAADDPRLRLATLATAWNSVTPDERLSLYHSLWRAVAGDAAAAGGEPPPPPGGERSAADFARPLPLAVYADVPVPTPWTAFLARGGGAAREAWEGAWAALSPRERSLVLADMSVFYTGEREEEVGEDEADADEAEGGP